MKSEESCFTDFNFSFITFPRQVFVKFFDYKTSFVFCRNNKRLSELLFNRN